ncbi:MAG: class I SAM-dependent methyltransferase [Parcubacteria group bacterium]|nr:class I SAM-dependent methyltransferase [Parcubacteria group bacterium]
MQKELAHNDLAKYYDLLYSWKDYGKEARTIKQLIKKYKKSDGKDLLEVACGTGKHIQYFKNDFSVLATDGNKGMLDIARKNVRGVPFKQADMVHLRLGKTFDVVLCLFSSIGYVKTLPNLEKTIKNFARHLNVGGVVIIEPWFRKSVYEVGSPHMTTYEDKDTKIARLAISEARGNVSVFDMHYLVAERNKEVRHFVDRHELGMFEPNDMLAFMKKAGLEAHFLKNGLLKDRGLYIGVKKN